jgi:hypothetical protein
MEAFSIFIPRDWEFSGGVRWSPEEVMMPAATGFRVTGNGITLQALPGKAFFWTDLAQVRARHPVGSRYLGAIVCPPMGPAEMIKDVILPSLRPEAAGLTLVCESPMNMEKPQPTVTEFQSRGSYLLKGYRTRAEYEIDGRSFEEEIFSTVSDHRFKVLIGGDEISYIFWTVDDIFSFSAEKGKLDKNRDILKTMMYSLRFSLQWLEKYDRITKYLKDRQVFRQSSLRQLSMDVDNVAKPDTSAMMKLYARKRSVYELIAGELGDGTDTGEYYDPIQQICVRLPDTYDRAWANGSGEYLLLNDGDMAPDGSFTEIWKMMERISLEPTGPDPSTASA